MRKSLFLLFFIAITLLGGSFLVVSAETTDERKERLESELKDVEEIGRAHV